MIKKSILLACLVSSSLNAADTSVSQEIEASKVKILDVAFEGWQTLKVLDTTNGVMTVHPDEAFTQRHPQANRAYTLKVNGIPCMGHDGGYFMANYSFLLLLERTDSYYVLGLDSYEVEGDVIRYKFYSMNRTKKEIINVGSWDYYYIAAVKGTVIDGYEPLALRSCCCSGAKLITPPGERVASDPGWINMKRELNGTIGD